MNLILQCMQGMALRILLPLIGSEPCLMNLIQPNLMLVSFKHNLNLNQTINNIMDKTKIQTKQFFSNFSNLQNPIDLPNIRPPPKAFQVGHYLVGEIIGRGTYGKVCRAYDILNQTKLAVKIIQLQLLGQNQLHHLKEEVSILKLVQHPNIVKFYQILKINNIVFLFMQHIEGRELFKLIAQKKRLCEKTALHIFKQICSAVKYIHSIKICHRDIKPENIMIQSDFNVKLIDFGLAKRLKIVNFYQTQCGSLPYKYPQILSSNFYSGKKNDIWSLGVLLFTMIEGRYPFRTDMLESMEKDQDKFSFSNFEKEYKEKIRFSSQEVAKIYQKIFLQETKRLNMDSLVSYLSKLDYLRKPRQRKNSNHQYEEYPIKKISIQGRKLNYLFRRQQKSKVKIRSEKSVNSEILKKSTHVHTQRSMQIKKLNRLFITSFSTRKTNEDQAISNLKDSIGCQNQRRIQVKDKSFIIYEKSD